ncbi:MAG: hypothetical protein SXG53_18595 [Pseudomonadota bacterium]|nr:hypothetical protein [Pseudomonadota bacterium]
MSRVFTWKVLSIAVGLVVAGAIACLIVGKADMASALFVVAALEGAAGAVVVGIANHRQKTKLPTAF